MGFIVIPTVGFFHAVGPHETEADYKKQAASKKFLGVKVGIWRVAALVACLAMMVNGIVGFGFIPELGLDDIASSVSAKSKILLLAVLNFLKGRAVTMVMSADLLMNTMISLRKFDVVESELADVYGGRMIAGLLASKSPKVVSKLLEEFDTDGDGQFDNGEIKEMIKSLHSLDEQKCNQPGASAKVVAYEEETTKSPLPSSSSGDSTSTQEALAKRNAVLQDENGRMLALLKVNGIQFA
jgi:hypothetical protein